MIMSKHNHSQIQPETGIPACVRVATTRPLCVVHAIFHQLQKKCFFRFQIRLDDFRGYLLKSIAEQTADEATIEEVHLCIALFYWYFQCVFHDTF